VNCIQKLGEKWHEFRHVNAWFSLYDYRITILASENKKEYQMHNHIFNHL